MLISEIFDSIDGEGIRAGQLCTFIRVVGCNLRCSYCDSMYAVEPQKYSEIQPKDMTVNEILSYVNRNYKRVTLTGGEPLLQPDSIKLVNRLCDMGYEVNIETNGACDVVVFRDMIKNNENMFFTIDFKLWTSGEMYNMRLSNFKELRSNDVVKFVIGSEEDLESAMSISQELIEEYGENAPYIYCGTVFGSYEMKDVIDRFMKNPLFKDVRFQLQLHKFIWDPDLRGV